MAGEPELHEPVALCTAAGRLHPQAVGWSRRPMHDCHLPGSWGRRKRWDYWCVTGPGLVLSLTLADVDYVGLADVWFLDLESRRVFSRSALVPLARGMALPERVAAGALAFARRGRRLAITEEDGGTRLTASYRDFEADLFVARPPIAVSDLFGWAEEACWRW